LTAIRSGKTLVSGDAAHPMRHTLTQNGNSAFILKLDPSARFKTPRSCSSFAIKNQRFPLSYVTGFYLGSKVWNCAD
jgi:hypothetical protein